MANAVKTKLLSFQMKDKAGLLSEITKRLAAAKVNITAVCAYSWDDEAYFDIAVESNARAKKALSGLGLEFDEEDVISVQIPNKIGELHKVAKVIGAAGINITYMYGTASEGRTSTCLFATSDNRKAVKLINR
jgi:hypothetical protein